MNKRIPIFFSMLLIISAVWLIMTPSKFVRGLMERLDNLGYDLQLRARAFTEHGKITAPVVIVDIDDKSLTAEGHWPWPRGKLAELTYQLEQLGAAVIAFDIIFSENEPNIAETVLSSLAKKNLLTPSLEEALKLNIPLFDEDKLFAQRLKSTSSVLAIGFTTKRQTENSLPNPAIILPPTLAMQLDLIRANGYMSNIPVLEQAATAGGFINAYPDNDGILRRAPLLINYGNHLYPSLSLQAVMVYLGEQISLNTPTYTTGKKLEGIQLGQTVIPTDEKGLVLIPFIGRSYTFPYYSATDVLKGNIPKNSLLGKIIFIGTSATGLGDLQATAIQNPFPGVEIQATLVNGILQNNFSYKPAWMQGENVAVCVLFGLIATFLFPYLGPRMLGTIIIVFPTSLFFLNNTIWEETGLIISLLMPMLLVLSIALLNMIYGYLFETRRRERLKEMFGQYVPEKHIDEMLHVKGSLALYGEDREMSVLFADIRNFTTISEGLSASELVEMLNTFFTPMTEIIFTHRGTIDKYVGDLIMAFWGAPLKDKRHARHAIQSALDMQKKVREMAPSLAERNWPTIEIGIGINSGVMSVGDMGSRFRRNYTVLGDSVNLASRVESLSKYYGVNIVVAENTERNQSTFVFRKLDKVKVKGKKLGVAIYEVVCTQQEASPALLQELALYHHGLDCYAERKWEDALLVMRQLHQLHPDTRVYALYIERLLAFQDAPPPEDWDGVYVHKTK